MNSALSISFNIALIVICPQRADLKLFTDAYAHNI